MPWLRHTVDPMQRGSRNRARTVRADMPMTVAFHTRDVCVGEQENSMGHITQCDDNNTVMTTRATQDMGRFARAMQSETVVVERVQNDAAK